ncbi:hypothetical protein GQE99_20410 [Maritimibacter sp. DP07]|uniref:GIY-YIG domain-containing protein n=1 Tax=Maritimibacter harenae TaxID=2606218 RepID=A0A845MAJ6_9RHOB|nr:hypothetical protein [Maritimibacter harenae]
MPTTLIEFPYVYWGIECRKYADVYKAAPFKPAVTLGGFIRRLRQRASFLGYVDHTWVERALREPLHGYNGGGAVYQITQKSTGRKYIGITDDPVARKKAHLQNYQAGRTRLQREILRAGPNDFVFEIIIASDCSRSTLKRIERALIKAENTIWPNGLNSLRGDKS